MRNKVLLINLSIFTIVLLLFGAVTTMRLSKQNNLSEVRSADGLSVKENTNLLTIPKNNPGMKDSAKASDSNVSISKGTDAAQKSTSGSVDKEKTAGAANNIVMTVSIAVVGKNQEIIYWPSKVSVKNKDAENVTVLDVLGAAGVNYETSSRWPGLVEVIGGLKNKGQSGWMYSVNDQIPMVSAAVKKVQEGDRIIWWYSEDIKAKLPVWEDLTAIKQSTP